MTNGVSAASTSTTPPKLTADSRLTAPALLSRNHAVRFRKSRQKPPVRVSAAMLVRHSLALPLAFFLRQRSVWFFKGRVYSWGSSGFGLAPAVVKLASGLPHCSSETHLATWPTRPATNLVGPAAHSAGSWSARRSG